MHFNLSLLLSPSICSIKEIAIHNKNGYEVYLVDHSRIQSLYGELHEDVDATETSENSLKRKCKLLLNWKNKPGFGFTHLVYLFFILSS